MKFSNFNAKDLIVRIKGDNNERVRYGLVKSVGKSLRYYPLGMRKSASYVYCRSNGWIGQAARGELGLPTKYMYRHHRDLIGSHADKIENKMRAINDYDIEDKVRLYVKYADNPFIIRKWKNRVWPIDEKYLQKRHIELRDLFLKYGKFSYK